MFSTKENKPYPLRSQQGRITLQPFHRNDIPMVESWLTDRETCELAFGVRAPWEILGTIRSEYIHELQRDTIGVLSIVTDPERPPIGFVRYKLFRKDRRKLARVGIVLGPTELRGKGLGREAFQTLLDHLFEKRRVTMVELDTAVFNHKAKACFEACGFEVIREMEFPSISGQWTEKRIVMRLPKTRWATLRSAAPEDPN